MSSEDPLSFAMDRTSVWRAASTLLKESGVEYSAQDIVDLAEFLAGDNIPYPLQELRSDDSDEQSTDSSTDSAE